MLCQRRCDQDGARFGRFFTRLRLYDNLYSATGREDGAMTRLDRSSEQYSPISLLLDSLLFIRYLLLPGKNLINIYNIK